MGYGLCEFKLKCSVCGGNLEGGDVHYQSGKAGTSGDLVLDIEPCETCLEKARQEGHDEGYDEGKDLMDREMAN